MRDPYIVRRRRTGIENEYLRRITELEKTLERKEAGNKLLADKLEDITKIKIDYEKQIKNMQRCGICGNYDQEEGCCRVSDETVNNWETCGIWKMIQDGK